MSHRDSVGANTASYWSKGEGYLILNVPNKNCSRRHLFFYFYLSKKIRLDFFYVNPLPSRGFN